MEKRKKKNIKEESVNGNFKVTIFGSARIKKGTLMYNQVRALAEMLGERGFDVITGGGPGLMKAASEGHKKGSKKTGARSIGVGIKLPHEQSFNKHLDIKKEFKRFSRRLDYFMSLSNAVVIAPGGIGTLLELFYTWQLAQVQQICNIPIILLGKQWPPLIKWFEKYPLKSKYFDKKDINLLFSAKDCSEAVEMIDNAYKEYKKGDKKFCLNFKKYKLK
jgi:hypothetical protein|tara:strand:+ start:7209 stop:7865 length:657 start_codon:yes stop_codon:yes gene_type:complete